METPKHGPAEWFAENLGLFTKLTEKYSAEEFLKRYANFLSVIHHQNALLAEIDNDEVYLATVDQPGELDDVLDRVFRYLDSSGKAIKVVFSTFGRTNHSVKDGLEIALEAQYNRRHGDGKPGIEVRFLGIPSILTRRTGETEIDHDARMKRLSNEITGLGEEKFAVRYENRAKVFLRESERELSKLFEVARATRWLHLEWGERMGELKPRIKV